MHELGSAIFATVSYRDAKLSVLDWDDNTHNIHTSSLHYFEGDPSIRLGRTVFPHGPNVTADPQVQPLLFIVDRNQKELPNIGTVETIEQIWIDLYLA